MKSSKILSEIMQKWINKRKKGHFAIYTKEGKRFVVPIDYLNHPIFKVLLEMAEEEFGTMAHGPLQVPCEEEFMEHIFALLRKNPSAEIASIPDWLRGYFINFILSSPSFARSRCSGNYNFLDMGAE